MYGQGKRPLQCSAKEMPCPWLNFSFVFSGQIYTENYLVTSNLESEGARLFQYRRLSFYLSFRVKFIEWRPNLQYCYYCGRPGTTS